MKTWKSFAKIGTAMLLAAGLFTPAVLASGINKVTNVSPSPLLTNEFYLTATNITVSINGTNVRALVYKDTPPSGVGATAGIPAPLIEATVGQMIICHFKNNLTNNIEGASIHWHGIELDNDSDGTAVVQDSVLSGQTYTYRFVMPRAGLFWYHSHMLPGTTTYGGMYGPIIVHDANEAALIAANVIPSTNNTIPLMMSDISFTNGTIGKVVSGTNYSLNTLIQFCENSILGLPGGDNSKCSPTGKPGELFLCNGNIPKLTGNYCTPTTNSSPVYYIGKNQRIRLQLFNASTSRTINLSLHYPCSNPGGNTNLYRIGGQGGFLDNVVLEGGVQGGYDFLFPKGTINIGSGMRADTMFYSSGNNGDVIQLLGRALPDPWKLDTVGLLPTNYPIAFFVVTNTASTNAPITNSMPILAAIGAQNEDLSLLNTNTLAVPPDPDYGTQDGRVLLTVGVAANGVVQGPNIGGYAATALDGNSGNGSWPDVPYQPSALWARAGDVLQLAVANTSQSVHPYHLHGFSMQPVAIYSANLQTNLYNYPYNEFLDTVDIYPDEALVFRIKLSDRAIFADSATGGPVTTATSADSGGNVGRWLMHCHIFLHGTIGMISELVVIPNTTTRLVGPAAGMDSVLLAGKSGMPWTVTKNAAWLHLLPGYSSGIGTTNILFRFDANPGATRVGELNVAGEKVVVTQAGTNYVKAPGPLTGLVTNGINSPFGITTDDNGNVLFSDSANGAIKRWNRVANTVSTLTSGWSTPYGLGLDRLGNLYFAQFNNAAIKKRFGNFPNFVVTAFTNTSSGVSGLAVDNANNVYITDQSEHAVKKWSPTTGTLTTLTTNGLVSPFGVAVDVTGKVYVSDVGDDSVKRLDTTTVIIFGIPFQLPFWNTLVNSNSLSNPYNLAVDDGGNVYIADGSHNAIKRWNATNSSLTTIVSSGITLPTGVAVDDARNLYISDWTGDAIRELPNAYVDPTAQSEPAEVTVDTLPVILPPTINLLPPFAPTPNQAWIFYGGSTTGVVQFAVGANLGAPRAGSLTVLGQAIPINQGGASSGIGTTNLLVGPAAGSNTVAQFVIPSVALWSASTATPWLHLPFISGTGSGNVLFNYDANPGPTRTGTLTVNTKVITVTQAGSTYVQAPGPLTTLAATGLSNPSELAVDFFGNVIFSDTGHNAVKNWSPLSNTVTSIITSGISTPEGVAVDLAGNIYLADFANHAIKKRKASDGSVTTLVDDSPNNPASVSLDSATNVYWVGPSDDAVKKWNAANGTVTTLVATNLNSPYGLAVDVAGSVFIADTFNHAIKKWNQVASSLTTLGTSGINTPWGVAVDGSGNVYVANGGSNNIVKWVAASGKFVPLVPNGVSNPTGVSVDDNQNVYIADFGNTAIKELPYAFVDPTAKFEPATAGSDSLPVILPVDQSLQAPFAPTATVPWLHLTGTAGGVVTFNYDANPSTLARAGFITLLGQNVFVQQEGIILPTVFTDITMLTNGVFQMSFTNGVRAGIYSVLFTTNVMVPTTSWTVIGTATNNGTGLWQFTDTSASNEARFYRIRSP